MVIIKDITVSKILKGDVPPVPYTIHTTRSCTKALQYGIMVRTTPRLILTVNIFLYKGTSGICTFRHL